MPTAPRPIIALAGIVGLSLGMTLLRQSRLEAAIHRSDDAPGRTARRGSFGGYQVTGRTVTINATPEVIYQHWRDTALLNRILGPGVRVNAPAPDRLDWSIATPMREITVETRLIEDRPGEMLAWRSVEGAEVEIEAKVQLRPAPAGRGTEVEAHVAWQPPLGVVGHWAAMLARTDPKTRGTRALKRLKMLLETGEIATADNRRAI